MGIAPVWKERISLIQLLELVLKIVVSLAEQTELAWETEQAWETEMKQMDKSAEIEQIWKRNSKLKVKISQYFHSTIKRTTQNDFCILQHIHKR